MKLFLILQLGLRLLCAQVMGATHPTSAYERDTTEKASALPEKTLQLYAPFPTDKVHNYVPEDSIQDEYPIPLAGYINPLKVMTLTSKYGIRDRQPHNGTDFLTEIGDTIYATFDGQVRLRGTDPEGYGQFLVLRHTNGLESVYGHLSKYLVPQDTIVHAGDPIALAGNSGRSTGPHLHLEFGFMGQPINPERLIDFEKGKPHMREFRYNKATRHRPHRWKPERMRQYVVQAGDTWETLGSKFRRSPKLLAKINHLSSDTPLKVGQTIQY